MDRRPPDGIAIYLDGPHDLRHVQGAADGQADVMERGQLLRTILGFLVQQCVFQGRADQLAGGLQKIGFRR